MDKAAKEWPDDQTLDGYPTQHEGKYASTGLVEGVHLFLSTLMARLASGELFLRYGNLSTSPLSRANVPDDGASEVRW